MPRNEILPGIWADTAETTIPAQPVTSTTYRDESFDLAGINSAWPFNRIVNSATTNQFLYLMSKIVKETEEKGIIEWSSLIDYTVNAWVRGSDGIVYASLQTPNLNQDPIAQPLFWEIFGGAASVPSASETVEGKLKLATQPLTDAGVNDLTAVTPLKLQTRLAALGLTGLPTFDSVNVIGNAATGTATVNSATLVSTVNGAAWTSKSGEGLVNWAQMFTDLDAAIPSDVSAIEINQFFTLENVSGGGSGDEDVANINTIIDFAAGTVLSSCYGSSGIGLILSYTVSTTILAGANNYAYTALNNNTAHYPNAPVISINGTTKKITAIPWINNVAATDQQGCKIEFKIYK